MVGPRSSAPELENGMNRRKVVVGMGLLVGGIVTGAIVYGAMEYCGTYGGTVVLLVVGAVVVRLGWVCGPGEERRGHARAENGTEDRRNV